MDRPLQVLIFTSPKAGSGARRDQVPRLFEMLRAATVDVSLVHTVTALREQCMQTSRSTSQVIIPAGGDGTISLAASCVGPEIPIVPMPLGTENLLARQFGHRAAAESVFQTIRCGASHRIDAGIAGGRLFLIMATSGFDAEVVRAMHLTRQGHIRRHNYFNPIVRAMRLYPFPTIQLRVDGEQTIECRWAMVFNLPQYATGLSIEPDAIGHDGLLDVIAFRGGSIYTGLKYLAGIKTGRHRSFGDVIRRRGASIELAASDRVPYQLDGDYVGRLPLKIETLPERVQLLLPPNLIDLPPSSKIH